MGLGGVLGCGGGMGCGVGMGGCLALGCGGVMGLGGPCGIGPAAPLQAPAPAPAPASENLSVSGLPFDITDEKVRTIIGQYGLVAQVKVLPPMPGRQDREAFVRMSKLDDAKWIVANVNDNVLEGIETRVNVQHSHHKGPLSPWGGLPVSSTGIQLSPPPLIAVPPAQKIIPLGVQIQGTVKRWDASKGFGFIGAETGGPDVFVHVRELSDGELLIPGSKVMFEAMLDQARGPGKYRAKSCLGAKPKEPAPTNVVSDKLFISGLPVDATEDLITSVFSQYGLLISSKILPVGVGKTELSALVHMGDINMAKWLVENVNGNMPVGMSTPVNISFASDPGLPAPSVIVPPASAGGGGPIDIAKVLGSAGIDYGKAMPSKGQSSIFGPYGGKGGGSGEWQPTAWQPDNSWE